MDIDTLRLFIFAVASLLFFNAAGLFLRTKLKAKDRAATVFLLSIALILFGHANVGAGLIYEFPALALLDLPAIYAVGPAFFFLFADSVLKNKDRRVWSHFVLPGVMLVVAGTLFFEPQTQRAVALKLSLARRSPDFYSLLHLAGILISGSL